MKAVLLAALLTSACAASPARIRRAMDPWIGQNVNALIARWGPPTTTFALPEGAGTVYTWLYQGETIIQRWPYTNLTTVDSSMCRFDWTVGPGGQVQTYRASGQCRIVH